MKRSLIDTLQQMLYAAWRRRYLICMPFVLMIPLSITAARFAPKTYEAKTILLLQETGKDNPFLKDYAVGLNLKDRISALQALLKSEHVMVNVLRDTSSSNVDRDRQQLAFEVRHLSANISLQLVGSDLLELKLKGESPDGLGRMLEAISNRFLERLLSPERSALGNTQVFLEEQTEKRRSLLEAAEQALSRFKTQNADKLSGGAASIFTRLGALKARLEEKAMESTAATAAFQDMRKQIGSTNPIVGRLEENIVQVTGELTSLRSRYTDDHSEVQAADRRLKRLQEERLSHLEVSRQIGTIDLDRLWSIASGQASVGDKATPPLLVSQLLRLQDAQAKRLTLEKDVEQIRDAVTALHQTLSQNAPIEQTQERLEKEVATTREAYSLFQKRLDSAGTSRALSLFEAPERIKVIDPPKDPTIPITPSKIIFILVGIISGLLLGIGLAVCAEMLDQRVRSSTDFEALAQVPLIARLSRITL